MAQAQHGYQGILGHARVLDADLATRQIHIERARRQESEAGDVR